MSTQMQAEMLTQKFVKALSQGGSRRGYIKDSDTVTTTQICILKKQLLQEADTTNLLETWLGESIWQVYFYNFVKRQLSQRIQHR